MLRATHRNSAAPLSPLGFRTVRAGSPGTGRQGSSHAHYWTFTTPSPTVALRGRAKRASETDGE